MSVILLSSLYKISHFTNFQVHKIQTKIWLHELHNNFIIFLNIKNIFPYFIVNVILGHIYVEDQIKVISFDVLTIFVAAVCMIVFTFCPHHQSSQQTFSEVSQSLRRPLLGPSPSSAY